MPVWDSSGESRLGTIQWTSLHSQAHHRNSIHGTAARHGLMEGSLHVISMRSIDSVASAFQRRQPSLKREPEIPRFVFYTQNQDDCSRLLRTMNYLIGSPTIAKRTASACSQ